MTARDFLPVSSPANQQSVPAENGAGCELGRKRSLFLDFLQDFGFGFPSGASQQGLTTPEEDQLLAELFQGSQAPPAGVLNDLPGLLTARTAPAAAPTAAKLEQAPAAAPTAPQAAAAASGRPLHHRAVVTSMPMPAQTRAEAAGAGGDDDTSSQNTMPMPNRKRRRTGEDDDEACSSPNDLVDVPAAQTAAAAAAAARKRQAASSAAHQDASSSRRDQSGVSSATAAAANAAASAASPDVHKGILVAKVLTKSDANSKRVILPRIAVETNLPQLSSAPHFHFTAADPQGTAWPLVIKAWANGSNPKPVYVMEMIGDVLKQYRLTIGDAVALLADEEGRFYLEWNTDAARAAAARPTYSGIVFKSSSSSSKDAASAPSSGGEAPAAAASSGPQPQCEQKAAEAVPAGSPRAAATTQQQHEPAPAPAAAVKSPFAAAEQAQAEASAAIAAADQQPSAAVKQEPQQQEAVPASAAAAVGPVTASQQQQLFQQLPASADMPLMTAIPVTSPQVPGTFIPTSPCQLLVVGHLPMPDLDLDLSGPATLQPSLPSSLLGHLNSNGDVVMPSAPNAWGPYGAAGMETAQSMGDEGLLVPTGAVPQLSHAGGVLLCPRTPGCTRPAGHQGWCLGHKGYKKRRV